MFIFHASKYQTNMCKTFAELAKDAVAPPREAPSDQEALYFLNDYEKYLFMEITEKPGLAVILANIIRVKLNGKGDDRIVCIANDWGVYLK